MAHGPSLRTKFELHGHWANASQALPRNCGHKKRIAMSIQKDVSTTPGAVIVPDVPAPWPILAALMTVALIVFGLAWELFLDPLRPGGSWLALKVLPLALALRGLYAGRIYTYKWMSLVIWIYVGEALVRVAGLTPSERLLAWNSLALSATLAVTILAGARAQMRSRKKIVTESAGSSSS
jgi:uncharacterized membrane protein